MTQEHFPESLHVREATQRHPALRYTFTTHIHDLSRHLFPQHEGYTPLSYISFQTRHGPPTISIPNSSPQSSQPSSSTSTPYSQSPNTADASFDERPDSPPAPSELGSSQIMAVEIPLARRTPARIESPPHPRSHPLEYHPPELSDSHSTFPTKPVYQLSCLHCSNVVCVRGMKAILLADTTVELFSTDIPPHGVQLIDKDYLTRTCRCRIRDVACLVCGNVVGYHVASPCLTCLEACNNGHFWMFHAEICHYRERPDPSGKKALYWSQLPRAESDLDYTVDTNTSYELICR